jgi:hypothetical protein
MGGTKVGSQTFSVRSGDIGNKTSGDMGYTFGRRACPGLQGFLFQIDTNQIPESTRSETPRRGHTTALGSPKHRAAAYP